MRAYRELLRTASVPRIVLIAVTTRLSAPMLSLSLLLALVHSGLPYASAGEVLTGYAAALALMYPMSARLMDRLRARRVLLTLLTVQMIAYVVTITAVTAHARTPLLVLCGLALGASNPPAGAVVRGTWPDVVPAEKLQTAYALDAVLNEAMFVSGPLLVSAILLFSTAIVAMGVAGLSMLVGALMLASLPSVATSEPTRKLGKRDFLGPLAHTQVLILLGIIVCDTFAFGSMMVVVPAAAADFGAGWAAGLVLSLASFGAVISGLVYGAWRHRRHPGRQLALFHCAGAILLTTSGHVPALWVLALIAVFIGLVGGPRDTLHALVLGKVAPPRLRTEAFAWMGTFMWTGVAIGTSTAGQLVSHYGNTTAPAFLAAGCGAAVAAMLSLLIKRTESAPESAAEAGTARGRHGRRPAQQRPAQQRATQQRAGHAPPSRATTAKQAGLRRFSPAQVVMPPVTRMISPVMKPAASSARNATVFAMSSGWPTRRTGVWAAITFCSFSNFTPYRAALSAVMSLTIYPGATALTVIPSGPSSIASVRVKPSMPAFVAA